MDKSKITAPGKDSIGNAMLKHLTEARLRVLLKLYSMWGERNTTGRMEASRSELEQTMVTRYRAPGMEPRIVDMSRFSYQPLGKWHKLGRRLPETVYAAGL